jgi:hypothetical protein
MSLKDALPAQVVMMLGVALEELHRSEAEPDLARVRGLITSAEATLIELRTIALRADEEVGSIVPD